MTSTGVKPTFLRSSFGGLPRPFWALWGGTLVNRLGTMVMPFTGVYLTQARGLSIAAAGLVMALFGAGSLVSQLLAGVLADRIGRRATLSGGMLATAAAMLALGYSTTLPAILASMFLLGLVADAYRPASNALVADLISPQERPRAYGLLFWAINLGYSVGMTAGGWLAQAGFLWLFWVDAVSCVAFAVLVWRAVPETRPMGKSEAGGFGVVLRDRVMVGFTLVILGNALLYSQTFTTLPMAMTEGVGLTTAQFGLAMALNGVLIVIVQPLASGWLGRRDPVRTLALGIAVMSAGFALTAFVTTTFWLAVTIAVWTAGEVVTAGIAGTILARLAPPHLRGRYSGLFGFSWSVAAVLAPLLGGGLLELGGPRALWFTTGGIGLVATAGMLALGPAIRRR
ncbi:MFS transporter [Nonomuraea glycinis]|uniref:MFS transporter n=1 Tax=Nonomuraea glycinis TaxID=2047744 RepID=A0A918E8J0_9ACTN|nr:MFS transporter [Nonomuraea glycinis]MCA2181717.1 MFS transporter [Nonomuraea glycinis]GGP14860.1 MFS transporter [Nonomuraea glycinis]